MDAVKFHPGSARDDGPPKRVVLRMEHAVLDYVRWKAAFDSDPLDRVGSGVIGHRVMRSIDDPDHVMIDLEFTSRSGAADMLERLQPLWTSVAGKLIRDPQARILEVAEAASD